VQFLDSLRRRIEHVPAPLDNEAWRREFVINPILQHPLLFGFEPAEIGAEIAYSLSPYERDRLAARFGDVPHSVRPDYIIVPADPATVAAVVEAKRRQPDVASHLRHASQLLLEQAVSGAPWGILTDGERWTVFRDDEPIVHADSLEDFAMSVQVFKRLVGRAALIDQVTRPKSLTVILLESSTGSRVGDSASAPLAMFPRLRAGEFRIVGPSSHDYNSFAFAAHDVSRWWYPHPVYYWPIESLTEDPATFRAAYEAVGFQVTEHPALEAGWERVALYISSHSVVAHAARQMRDGTWISKLGAAELIQHVLGALEGDLYGVPSMFLKRKRTVADGSAMSGLTSR
jgi:hypothetical protein